VTESETKQDAASAEPGGPGQLIARLAHGIAGLDPGERARLRRAAPGEPPSPAVLGLSIRLLTAAGAEEDAFTAHKVARFALLLRAMALLAGTREDSKANPHERGVTLGRALRDLLTDGGKREPEEVDARLLALLAARGGAFDALLERSIRRLAAAGVGALDHVALWRLIEWPDGDEAERARLDVARDFYRKAPANTPA